MKKKQFIVEVEYNEKDNQGGDALYDVSMEIMLEEWMDGFIEAKSIEKDYYLTVREITKTEAVRDEKSRLREQAHFVLEEQTNGTWETTKDRYSPKGRVILNEENFLEAYENTVVFYLGGGMSKNFKLY